MPVKKNIFLKKVSVENKGVGSVNISIVVIFRTRTFMENFSCKFCRHPSRKILFGNSGSQYCNRANPLQ